MMQGVKICLWGGEREGASDGGAVMRRWAPADLPRPFRRIMCVPTTAERGSLKPQIRGTAVLSFIKIFACLTSGRCVYTGCMLRFAWLCYLSGDQILSKVLEADQEARWAPVKSCVLTTRRAAPAGLLGLYAQTLLVVQVSLSQSVSITTCPSSWW